MLPKTDVLLRVVAITLPAPALANVTAPATFNVFGPRLYVKALVAPVIVALTPVVELPPATLMALSPTAPPTAPVRELPPFSTNVPVCAPAVVVTAPVR